MRIFNTDTDNDIIITLSVWHAGPTLKEFTVQPLRYDRSTCPGCGVGPHRPDAPGWKFVGFDLFNGAPNTYTLCPAHWAEFRQMSLRALLESEI